ncbi:MAG: hypothetical protein J6W27_02030 [Alphaproteobacteria bacterium]|nr:hypothetical protein [Alphaproteobacteria bacterium]
MRKFLNISVIAALAILPMAANAATGDIVSVSDPATYTGNANVTASTAPKYALAVEAATDTTNVATASYVKGAYNAAMKAINKVSETASSAVKSVGAGTANGTISVDGGADVTVYDDTALAGRVTTAENKIGNTTLTTTAQTLTGAIEEVKGTAGFAGTAAELTDDGFQAADKTSAATAANAAMAAAAAAQADVDAVEGTIGNTPLTTTATTLTGAIEEVKSNALTSSSLTDYAKKSGVTQTITNSTITGTVPTVIAWGAETTSTAEVTASITGATYAEPSNP